MHVKKNDLVVVLSGNERGKRGKVLHVDVAANRVTVEGVRMIKKAMRKSQDRPQGGIQQKEGSLHASNVMKAELYDARQARKKKNG